MEGRDDGSKKPVSAHQPHPPVFQGGAARFDRDAGVLAVSVAGRRLCGAVVGRRSLCRHQPGYAAGHHQLCHFGPDRRGFRGADLGTPGGKAPRGSQQHLHLRLPDGDGPGHRGGGVPVPGVADAAALDGRRGRAAGNGDPVYPGVRHHFAGDRHALRGGQLPAHLRAHQRQHDAQRSHVGALRAGRVHHAGGAARRRVGRSAGYQRGHDDLRGGRHVAVLLRQPDAEIPPPAFHLAHHPADRHLRHAHVLK